MGLSVLPRLRHQTVASGGGNTTGYPNALLLRDDNARQLMPGVQAEDHPGHLPPGQHGADRVQTRSAWCRRVFMPVSPMKARLTDGRLAHGLADQAGRRLPAFAPAPASGVCPYSGVAWGSGSRMVAPHAQYAGLSAFQGKFRIFRAGRVLVPEHW